MAKQIMEAQQDISLIKNTEHIGKTYNVLIDEFHQESSVYSARTQMDAPEIDNEVIIRETDKKQKHSPGTFVKVKIVDASEYELYASFV